MKVTDYIAKFLLDKNIHIVFGVTGGSVVHFFDSIDKLDDIETIFTHHEQAATYAASGYSRINGIACAIVTTGPGGTNAISGVAAMYLDSIPCIIISGQTRYDQCNYCKPVRQIGTQAMDIVSLVKPIVKEVMILDDVSNLGSMLEHMYKVATTGRPGPVWIDVPLDFQWADYEED